jgi:ASC-1-like (ASCH) protein
MNMITSTEICKEITFGSFSNEDLNEIAQALKSARSRLGRTVTRSVTRGDKVSFFNSRSNVTVQGVVDSIKIKNVIVNANGTKWRVPANMLTVL